MHDNGRHGLIIVGSGNMARTHAKHWRNIPEVELIAVATRDGDTAGDLQGADGAEVFDSLEIALDKVGDRVTIVDVCTPTPTHAPLACLALGAGKHLFLEKPMARSLAECDAIVEAARRSATTAMVGQVVRFFPQYRQAHRAVGEGAVGVPAAIRTARLAGPPRGSWHDWYFDAAQSGGVVLDMIVHDFDWLLWTFGPVDRVFAKGLYGRDDQVGGLDYALCMLHHISGALSHVTGSWAHTGGFRTTFEICGDRGMIEHDSAALNPLSIARRESVVGERAVAVPESPMSPLDDPYYLELRHFTDCVQAGRAPEVTLGEGRAAVEVSLACLESIETGRPVLID